MGHHHKKAKKPKLNKAEQRLLTKTRELIEPLGCRVIGLGPQAVGVLGDAREVGIAIVVRFCEGADIGTISTMITNRVRGITRVLMAI